MDHHYQHQQYEYQQWQYYQQQHVPQHAGGFMQVETPSSHMLSHAPSHLHMQTMSPHASGLRLEVSGRTWDVSNLLSSSSSHRQQLPSLGRQTSQGNQYTARRRRKDASRLYPELSMVLETAVDCDHDAVWTSARITGGNRTQQQSQWQSPSNHFPQQQYQNDAYQSFEQPQMPQESTRQHQRQSMAEQMEMLKLAQTEGKRQYEQQQQNRNNNNSGAKPAHGKLSKDMPVPDEINVVLKDELSACSTISELFFERTTYGKPKPDSELPTATPVRSTNRRNDNLIGQTITMDRSVNPANEPHEFNNTSRVVDVGHGGTMTMRCESETRAAVSLDEHRVYKCWGCDLQLASLRDVGAVYCTACQTISPANEHCADATIGVGLDVRKVLDATQQQVLRAAHAV